RFHRYSWPSPNLQEDICARVVPLPFCRLLFRCGREATNHCRVPLRVGRVRRVKLCPPSRPREFAVASHSCPPLRAETNAHSTSREQLQTVRARLQTRGLPSPPPKNPV